MSYSKDPTRLKYPRARVRVATMRRNDYVYDRLGVRWVVVDRLVRRDGVVFVEGLHTDNRTGKETKVIVPVDECYPSWNPHIAGWDREIGSSREKYWAL